MSYLDVVRRRQKAAFFGVALALAALFVVWYPSAIAIEDEAAYLAQADIFSRGKVIGTGGSDGTTAMVQLEDGWVSKYPPGQSLLIALTRMLPGWRAAFLVPAVMMVLLTVMFAEIMRRMGLSRAWAILLMLHPAIVLYSRTLMSDLTAATILTAAYLATDPKRPRWLLAGLLLGIAPLVRSAIVPLGMIMGLFAMARASRESPKALGQLVGGAILTGLLTALYYRVAFGGPFSVPPGAGPAFDLTTAPERLFFYIAALNLVWPLQLIISVTIRHERRTELRALVLFNILFFSAYYFVDRRYGVMTDMIVGQRFFVPLIPLMLIPYAKWLARMKVVQFRHGLVAVTVLFALAGDAALVYKHQALLDATAERRDAAMSETAGYERVLVHTSASELFNPAWESSHVEVFFLLEDLERKLDESACNGIHAVGVAQGFPGTTLSLDLSEDPGPIPGLAFIPSDSLQTDCNEDA